MMEEILLIYPTGSMYGIYANIGGNGKCYHIYIAYMDPMGIYIYIIYNYIGIYISMYGIIC